MKYILVILLSIFLNNVFAQQEYKNILVEYNYDNGYFLNKETLIANTKKAIKSTGKLSVVNENNIVRDDENGEYHLIQKNVDVQNKEIFSTLNSNIIKIKMPFKKNKIFFVKDSITKFNWKLISNESIKIMGYTCEKATLNFRGRDYIAFYTTELPISFGPWKFKGLPGLILNIFSTTGINRIGWKVKKIKYPFEKLTDLNWNKKLDNKLISLKKYIEILTEEIEKKGQIITTRISKGVKIKKSKINRQGNELIYEWEEK